MPALRLFTVDDLDALPDDLNRYEVLHGVLLVPARCRVDLAVAGRPGNEARRRRPLPDDSRMT